MAAPLNKRGRASTKEHRRAQAELMWTDRINGMTNHRIAEKHGVSDRTVTNRFEEFPKEGYERPSGFSTTGADQVALQSETALMWDDKINLRMSNEQLAEKYSVSVATVQKRLNGYFPRKAMLELEQHRLREDDKLDMLEEEMMVLMNTEHYVVDKGQVIHDPYTGKPLIDSEPKFKAVDRMLKIIEAKRKLFGLDAPVKAEVKHTADTSIQIQEVSDAVAQAHRKNQERLAQIRGALGDGIVDAEIVEDGTAPTEGDSDEGASSDL